MCPSQAPSPHPIVSALTSLNSSLLPTTRSALTSFPLRRRIIKVEPLRLLPPILPCNQPTLTPLILPATRLPITATVPTKELRPYTHKYEQEELRYESVLTITTKRGRRTLPSRLNAPIVIITDKIIRSSLLQLGRQLLALSKATMQALAPCS